MKILIGQKNSSWKVVQNPLKGNYYTDVLDFENDADKEAFLNANFVSNWKTVDVKYIEVPINWTDEIHGSFTVDLELVGFTRKEATRKDFGVIYDENEKTYTFVTLECSLDSRQVYTTLKFNFELDVFFQYGIRNIFKPQAQVALQRGVFKNQWTVEGQPNALLGDLITLTEDFQSTPVLTKSWLLDDQDVKGYIVYVRPQKRSVINYGLKTASGRKINYTGVLEDTLILGSTAKQDGSVSLRETLLLLNMDDASRPIYSTSKGVCSFYPDGQLIDKSKKSMAFVKIWYPVDGVYYKDIANLLNSPDVIRIEPSNTLPIRTRPLESVLIGQDDYEYIVSDPDGNNEFYFKSTYSPNIYTNLSIITESFNISSFLFEDPLSSTENHMFDKQYFPEQYAKLILGLHRNIKMVNAKGQFFNLVYENAQNYFFQINRKKVSTPQGTSSLTTVSSGAYVKGDLYNPFAWQEDLTVNRWQTSNEWLTYVNNNAQSVNMQARQQRVDYTYQKELNRLEGLQSNREAADVPIGTVFDTIKGLFGGSITQGAKRVLDWETQATTADYNRAILKNAINTQAATIADAQSGRGQTRDMGGDYDRLKALANPFAINVQVWELVGEHKKSIADYYHQFGYSTAGSLVNPAEWLNNGAYWDFFQASFNSVYQAFNESLSPQESKIAALSIDQGVRVWHWRPNLPLDWEVGNYKYRNVKS